jgi:hypothetical protein
MSDFRERLLAALNKPAGTYPLPDGTAVPLRRWALADWLAFEQVSADKSLSAPERLAKLLALCIADEENAPALAWEAALEVPFGEHVNGILDACLDANRGEKKLPPTTSAKTPN